MRLPKPDYAAANGRIHWILEQNESECERHEITLARHGTADKPRWTTYETRHRSIGEAEAHNLLRRYGRVPSGGLTHREATALMPEVTGLLVRQLDAHGVDADEGQARAVAAQVLQVLQRPLALPGDDPENES